MNRAQRKAVTENAEVVTVDSDFVKLVIGKDDDLKRLVLSDLARSVSFFRTPSVAVVVVSDDDAISRLNRQMESDVVTFEQARRAQKVDLTSANVIDESGDFSRFSL